MTTTTKLTQIRDINNFQSSSLSGRDFSAFNQFFTLTANTIKVVTVPAMSGQNFIAYFNYTDAADIWVCGVATPDIALPSGTVTATLAQLRPNSRLVIPGQVLQFISAATTPSVGIEYYQILSTNVTGY